MAEDEMYEPIRKLLLEIFKNSGHKNVHLEITSDGSFSSTLTKALGTTIGFLGRHFAPDLCGFVQSHTHKPELISVEVKRKRLGFKEIFQAKGYAELIDAKYAFLISNERLISAIKSFLRAKESVLYFGYPNTKILHIGLFSLKTNRFIEEEWFPKSPF